MCLKIGWGTDLLVLVLMLRKSSKQSMYLWDGRTGISWQAVAVELWYVSDIVSITKIKAA